MLIESQGREETGGDVAFETPEIPLVPNCIREGRHQSINLLAVKHFPPSPITSWVEAAPHAANVSHVTVPDSRNRKLKSLCEERLTSSTIHDIHLVGT